MDRIVHLVLSLELSPFLKKNYYDCAVFVAFLRVIVFYHLQDYQILSNLH